MMKPVPESFIMMDPGAPGTSGEDWEQRLKSALERLADSGVLKLTTGERPDVLTTFLRSLGYRVNLRQWPDKTWDIEALADKAPEVIDLRNLEAPEPMERILTACAGLAAGDGYLARLPHVPFPLFPHLQSRGMKWQVHEERDQSALLMIWRDT